MLTVKGDIIAIGSELLHGGRVDSNSIFLSGLLAECGIEVRKKLAVGDNKTDIQDTLRDSLRRSDVIILSGGLGSTFDDCTREAIAELFRRPLIRRKKAYQALQARYRQLGKTMTPLVARQALLPSKAVLLPNPVGTASGFLLHERASVIAVIPGVPREAKEMMISQVQPLLRKIFPNTRQYFSHAFNTFGLTELEVQQLLDGFFQQHAAIHFGLLASPMGVKVTMSGWKSKRKGSSASTPDTFSQKWDELVSKVRLVLGPYLFSEGDLTLEEIVGARLRSHSWTIGLAESCTGGLIAHRMTEVPGSSLYLDRGVVSYSNSAKQETLGVSKLLLRRYGAVSSPVAQAMAAGVRRLSHVDIGVGVTGIAGPGGESAQKPVGLVYCAIDGPRGSQCLRWQFHGNRSEIKLKTSQAALNFIRQYAE